MSGSLLGPPQKRCGEYGGTTEDGEPCEKPAGHGRGFIRFGMCSDCYFRIQGPMNTTSPGRPKKFDPGDEEIEYIKRLASVLNQEQIAGVFGVSGETLRRRKKEDPRIEVAIQQGKAEAVATVGTALLKKARDGDTISQIFYLKAQGGWRDRHDVVHSGKIEHEVDFPKLREDLGRMLGDMADRRVKAKLLKPTMFANENEDEEPGKPFEVIEGGASDSDDG